MKKVLITLLIILLCGGCQKTTKVETTGKKETNNEKPIEVKETYKDLNNTPIGIYSLNGNTLTKLTSINKNLNVEEDIGLFQIFLSNEDTINLTDSFANTYYYNWTQYNPNNNIKLGFNIKFSLKNGENISYNILTPANTFDKWEYLMNYLYDDYANRFKGSYSHIENNEYNENTLFTAIKLQSSYQCYDIASPIELTAFTYDTEDDFLDNEYRGNSKYTITINTINN